MMVSTSAPGTDMTPQRIGIIIGSLREGSFNRQLAAAVQRLAGERFAFDVIEIAALGAA